MKNVWIALLVTFLFTSMMSAQVTLAQSQPIATDKESIVSQTVPNERRVVIERVVVEEAPVVVQNPPARTQYETPSNIIAYNVREVSTPQAMQWEWQELIGLVLFTLGVGILLGGRSRKQATLKQKHPDYL